jgi:hypothetical protein
VVLGAQERRMVEIAMVAGQDPSSSLRLPLVDGKCLDTAIVISHGGLEEAFREQKSTRTTC